MKKIISALVLGAVAAGIATADLSIKANSKLSTNMFSYDSEAKTKKLFGLSDYANPQDNVTLAATGNIFTFTATLQPYAERSDIRLKMLTAGAKAGNFTFETGWNRDGTAIIKSAGSAGNDEGKVFESYKIGGAFGDDAAFVNNQVAFGKDQPTYFAQAGYGIPVNNDVKLNITAAALSPHGFKESATGKPDKLGDRNYNVGWSVFVSPVVKKVITAEVFAKGYKSAKDTQRLFFGAYVKPTGIDIVKDAAFGGSVYLDDGELEEWNIDLRLVLQLAEQLKLTTLNKFASKDAATTLATALGLSSGSLKGEQMLWDMVSLEYRLNETIALTGTVAQQTIVKAGNGGAKGTQLFVYPHAQIFASSAASITAGVVLTIDQINMTSQDAKAIVDVPLVVKIAL